MQIDVSYKEEYLHPAGEPMEGIYQAYCPRSETDQITKFIRSWTKNLRIMGKYISYLDFKKAYV